MKKKKKKKCGINVFVIFFFFFFFFPMKFTLIHLNFLLLKFKGLLVVSVFALRFPVVDA